MKLNNNLSNNSSQSVSIDGNGDFNVMITQANNENTYKDDESEKSSTNYEVDEEGSRSF